MVSGQRRGNLKRQTIKNPALEGSFGPPIYSATRYRMLVETMRPRQWTKNAFVRAGVVFSGGALEADAQARAWVPFAAFCAVSSASYLVNDVRDRHTDQLNPRTAGRPIARGSIG